MVKSLIQTFVFAMVLLSVGTLQAAVPKMSMAETGAKDTHVVMNSFGTVGNMMKFISFYLTEEESKNAWRVVSSMGLTKDMKIPELKLDGKKVYFDKANYLLFNEDRSVEINGELFVRSDEMFDVVMQQIFDRLNKKSASAYFIPRAHAFGILAALAVMGGGAILGGWLLPQLTGMDQGTGSMLGLLAGGLFSYFKMDKGNSCGWRCKFNYSTPPPGGACRLGTCPRPMMGGYRNGPGLQRPGFPGNGIQSPIGGPTGGPGGAVRQ